MRFKQLQQRFDSTWKKLAQGDFCDRYGGLEYFRVAREWLSAGCPRQIRRFILSHSNQASTEATSDPEHPVKRRTLPATPATCHWQDLIPPDWRGECVLCGAMLGPDDFRQGRVISTIPGPGYILALCVHHVSDQAGNKSADYDRAVFALAKATVRALDREG